MNLKIVSLINHLNEQLYIIDLEIGNEIKRCEKTIEIILKAKEVISINLKSNFKIQGYI